jgi:hypothetical protein
MNSVRYPIVGQRPTDCQANASICRRMVTHCDEYGVNHLPQLPRVKHNAGAFAGFFKECK